MRRALSLLAAGAALGAAITYYGNRPAASLASLVPIAAQDAAVAVETAADGTSRVSVHELIEADTVAARAALYRIAAQYGESELRTLIPEVAALRDSEGRRFALGALLARNAEIDPRSAIRAAEQAALATSFFVALYRDWVQKDSRAALDSLRELRDRGVARAVGLALVNVLGGDEVTIARIRDAVPDLDATALRVEAAVASSATDPLAALDAVRGLAPAQRAMLVARIAQSWVADGLDEALRRLGLVADEPLRSGLHAAILQEWGRHDPDAMLEHFVALDVATQQRSLGGLMTVFAQLDPYRAIELAERLPDSVAQFGRQMAVENLAQQDALAALGYVENLPLGPQRQNLLNTIAHAYGRQDPEGAIAWAQNLSPPDPGTLSNVLTGVAQVDPDRAIDVALSLEGSGPEVRMFPLMALMMNGTADAQAIANRLSAARGANRTPLLQSLLGQWANTAPEDALQWALANRDSAVDAAFPQIGMQLGQRDPAAAGAYASQIPDELRASWLPSVASGYAQTDPTAATSWLAQYRGQPGYAQAVAVVAQATAQYDAPAAARLLETVDDSAAVLPMAPTIAFQWARQDPRAAAQWAADLEHPDARVRSIATVAGQWVQSDLTGARNWAMGLAPGQPRDAALTPVLAMTFAQAGMPDHTLLTAFSTDNSRQQGLSQGVIAVARTDPERARRLADDYVTDPAMRANTDRIIEATQQGAMRGNFFPQPGIAINSAVMYGPTGISIPIQGAVPASRQPTR